MRTFNEIEEELIQTKKRLYEEYVENMKEILRENGLDGDVISIKTGKKGRILIERYVGDFANYRFHTYNKSGELSQKGCLDDNVYVWSNTLSDDLRKKFKRADNENT